ncbi:MFS transporter [Paenibacillus thermotolerans]|uniref:MFS transporter n=1 Tax=Paenibacillus thermotolerans TaxID=3027807 RepID=UPI0023688566|nr:MULTISPECIES: MFS transporter [unclassified Paenibacillus]
MIKQLNVVKGLQAFYYAQNAVFLPYLPLYFAAKGFSAAEIGVMMMAGPFVAVFAQPVWGFVSDKLQTVRNIVAILWVLAFLSGLGVFVSNGFAAAFLFITLHYFFVMPSSPLLDSLTIRTAEMSRVSYGAVRLWGSIGFSAAAVLTGVILMLIGGVGKLQWIYVTVWIFPLALLLLLKDVGTGAPPITLSSLSAMLRNKSFLWFLLLVFVMMLPHRMNDSFLGLYMKELGAGEQLIGMAWALAALSEVPVFALLHRYMRNIHEFALLGIVGLLFVIRWGLFAVTDRPEVLFIMQLGHSVTFAAFWVTAVAYAVRVVPPQLRSTGQSLLSAVFIGLSGITGGIFGGWLERWGGYPSAYAAGAVLAGVAGIAFLATHAAARRGGSRAGEESL